MKDKEFWLEVIEELNLIHWLIVLVCLIIYSFGGKNDFIRYVGLGALPTGQMVKQIKGKEDKIKK
jgi:hypothetical protein